jgi:hypothetical protein
MDMSIFALALATVLAAAPEQPPSSNSAGLKDGKAALLSPCTPETAAGRVTAIAVVDDKAVNAASKKQKSSRPLALPGQLFLSVTYKVGDKTEMDFRQVNTSSRLTTNQAQALIGERVCVVRYAQ